MFTRLINWIKRTLWLHMPLWICGSLGILALFLPETPRPYVVVFLFGAYFLSRYLWRRHLKKQDKLGKASSGLLSLLFWASVGLFAIYKLISPSPPEIAVYAGGAEPEAYDDDDKKSGLKRKHSAKKGLIGGSIKRTTEALKAQKLACGYITQEALTDECSASKLVELDNDFESLEVFTLSGNQSECEQTHCHLWLIQVNAEQRAAYEAYSQQEEKPEPWVYQGTAITSWKNVKLPIRIEHDSHNGWRKLRVTHTDGRTETW